MRADQRLVARGGAGAPRADSRGAGAHQATSVRARLASAATRAVNAASRRLGRGQGTVAGGRAGLRLDPKLLEHLSAGRQVALVTGTNGKTTTTRLLTVALAATGDAVVSNETGSNMPPGHVAALAGSHADHAVLEVDEVYLPRVLTATGAVVVVLLNLSRDQLDRTNEVRMVAGRWRAALAAAPHTHVVANADDPLVAWGAGVARDVHWVGAGLRWQLDAVGCPACEGRIEFGEGSWSCSGVRLRPPRAGGDARAVGRRHAERHLGRREEAPRASWRCPAGSTRPTRSMAAVAAEACGVDAFTALEAMAGVEQVAGPLHRALLRRGAGPPHAGQEPGRVGRAARPGGRVGRAARGEHQRPGRRRRRPQLAVGRALRAPGRALRGGDRRPLPRPLGAPALRRRGPHHGARPGARRHEGGRTGRTQSST